MATRQFPHPSAEASSFKVGDSVRRVVSTSQSPDVGKVTHVHPGINKVDVEFPVGGNQRFSPEDIILVPKEQGTSPVTKDTSYSSYDKSRSESENGKMADKAKKMAAKVAARTAGVSDDVYKTSKMASDVAEKFAADVVGNLAADTAACVQAGLNDAQAYQKLYPKYASICSDGFMRSAIGKVYKEAFLITEKPQIIKWIEQEGFRVEESKQPQAYSDLGIKRYRVAPREGILEFQAGDPNLPDTKWTDALDVILEPDQAGGWVFKVSKPGEVSSLKTFTTGDEQKLVKYLKDVVGKDTGLKKTLE